MIAWPLMAELVLGFGVGLLGLWLASRESDTASAAFALSNQVLGTFFLLFRIVSMGVSVVITQNLGAGNVTGANDIARASLGASTWLGIGAALVVFFGAGPLLGLLDAPEPVNAIGEPYLQMLALALLLDAYNASMASVMRAHLRTRDAMLNILSMHALHLLLCLPLMRGFGPIPAFGLPGFALAMAISRAFGVAIHLLLWRWRLHLVPSARDWWMLRTERLGPVLHIGLPGAAENIAYRLAMLASLTAVAGMGTAQLATHTYASQVMNIIVLFTVSIGFAGEILVGHLIGAGPAASGEPDGAPEPAPRTGRLLPGRHRRRCDGALDAAPVHSGPGHHRRGHHPALDHRAAGAGPHLQHRDHQCVARHRRCAVPRRSRRFLDAAGDGRRFVVARSSLQAWPGRRVDRLRGR